MHIVDELLPIILFAVIGLCLGSFATALAPRVFAKDFKGLLVGRSACVKCKNTLKAIDLIPVISWVLIKGRCSNCGEKISSIYPIIEGISALFATLVYLKFGICLQSVLMMLALPIMLSLLLVDLRHYILPNELIFALATLGLAQNPNIASIVSGILYAALPLVVGKCVSFVLKKESLGLGDVKFCFAAVVWLGISALPAFFVLSGALGIMLGSVWKAKGKGNAFPFGPALIVSMMVLLLYPISL